MRRRTKGVFEREQLVALYEAGMPVTQIAELDGTDRITVHYHLRAAKAVRTPHGADTEIAWLAGLIDGEGCITVGPEYRGTRYLSLQVGMTDRLTIERVREIARVGSITKRAPKQRHRSPAYYYQAQGHGAMRLLKLVAPHLVTKREQATFALEHGPRLSMDDCDVLKAMNSSKGNAS